MFCLCQGTEVVGDVWQQLLRLKLFPATIIDPHTACTFRVLELYHVLTLQGKVSLYDFYAGLEKRSDNSGGQPVKVGDNIQNSQYHLGLLLYRTVMKPSSG